MLCCVCSSWCAKCDVGDWSHHGQIVIQSPFVSCQSNQASLSSIVNDHPSSSKHTLYFSLDWWRGLSWHRHMQYENQPLRSSGEKLMNQQGQPKLEEISYPLSWADLLRSQRFMMKRRIGLLIETITKCDEAWHNSWNGLLHLNMNRNNGIESADICSHQIDEAARQTPSLKSSKFHIPYFLAVGFHELYFTISRAWP